MSKVDAFVTSPVPILNYKGSQQYRRVSGVTSLRMGGKVAKFGVFSPAVYAAKIVLGDKKLKGIRGKAISLHSQAIGDFCTWSGSYHLRTKIIKKPRQMEIYLDSWCNSFFLR